MRNVLFAAPFPLETTLRFARAAARLEDVRLLGVVVQPPGGADARLFADQVTVRDPLDPGQLIAAARHLQARHGPLHRAVGILEPLMGPLAAVRDALDIPGVRPATAALFRDKARMKDVLRAHGLPCARHRRVTSAADLRAFVEEVGTPIVLKPLEGMGSKATFRLRDRAAVAEALDRLTFSPHTPAIAEEFLVGREASFETITIGGEARFHSFSHYQPTPLDVLENPWIQWAVVHPRTIDGPDYEDARAMGLRAIRALGLETGFTHMEWFRRPDGSLAIGEIAARPPGARIVDANNLVHDADLHRAWARAVIDDAFDGPWERRHAVGVAFLRAMGQGRVVRIRGVAEANAQIGRWVVDSRLPALGTPRADTYEGEGHVTVRHPETEGVQEALRVILGTVRIEVAR